MTTISKLRKAAAAALVVTLLGTSLAPATSLAQSQDCLDPTGAQYRTNQECVEDSAGSGGSGSTSAPVLERNVGPLPFTGFDVIAMSAVALAVAGLGLLLQRAVARQPE